MNINSYLEVKKMMEIVKVEKVKMLTIDFENLNFNKTIYSNMI